MKANDLLPLTVLLIASPGGVNANPTPDNSSPMNAPAPEQFRQSRDDAWWTGPLLAASPVTLPQGHFLIEPYVFDV
ncbi:MAG: hypothetical protein JO042_08460, partial [Sinobacteraceae bacterium]|nr:hypothetical protein [Nevskiaceae bacterium]